MCVSVCVAQQKLLCLSGSPDSIVVPDWRLESRVTNSTETALFFIVFLSLSLSYVHTNTPNHPSHKDESAITSKASRHRCKIRYTPTPHPPTHTHTHTHHTQDEALKYVCLINWEYSLPQKVLCSRFIRDGKGSFPVVAYQHVG